MPGIVERAVLRGAVPVERVEVSAFTIPTDFPESDGTIAALSAPAGRKSAS
jgi:hypothetical protein